MNEDLDYNYESSLTKTNNIQDIDHNNISLLKRHLKDIETFITKHNSLDAIHLQDPKFSINEQMIANKLLVTYLRAFKEDVANKIKELSNGR